MTFFRFRHQVAVGIDRPQTSTGRQAAGDRRHAARDPDQISSNRMRERWRFRISAFFLISKRRASGSDPRPATGRWYRDARPSAARLSGLNFSCLNNVLSVFDGSTADRL